MSLYFELYEVGETRSVVANGTMPIDDEITYLAADEWAEGRTLFRVELAAHLFMNLIFGLGIHAVRMWAPDPSYPHAQGVLIPGANGNVVAVLDPKLTSHQMTIHTRKAPPTPEAR